MMNKKIHIIGGGTFSHIRNHLSLAAPAFGTTAKQLAKLCQEHRGVYMDTELHLTKMADSASDLVTGYDVDKLVKKLVDDPLTKIIFMNAAIVDFDGSVEGMSGKHAPRLSSKIRKYVIDLEPAEKTISKIRKVRKDIFLIGFKTTTGATPEEQYQKGLNLVKEASCNLVLANDVVTRRNMIITPEEAAYDETTDRAVALQKLVSMVFLRSHLTFTRSTVIAGEPIAWNSPAIPASLRTIVDYCIARGAYKRFRGVTAGHFAVKLGPTTFLTSRRKTDFNDMSKVGLVKVETDGPDSVLAYGSRPSVGGQSQRILFEDHPEFDCVVHFHCPMKGNPRDSIPTVSQRAFECGSHECGKNTSNGLGKWFNKFGAVYLDKHGPNIVFHHSIDPAVIIDFIDANFILEEKTGGYMV